MKFLRIFLFTAIALLAVNCATPGRLVEYHVIDFRPYINDGFRIYSSECPVVHEQLGDIQVVITPAVAKVVDDKKRRGTFDDAVYSKGLSGQFENLKNKDLLDPIVNIAKEMGGNGIAMLSVSFDGFKWHVKGTVVLTE
jgi:hypothetical protein